MSWFENLTLAPGPLYIFGDEKQASQMAAFIETVIIAVTVSLGIIVGGAAIVRGLVISRRSSHHLATRTGTSPVPPTVDMRPPGG